MLNFSQYIISIIAIFNLFGNSASLLLKSLFIEKRLLRQAFDKRIVADKNKKAKTSFTEFWPFAEYQYKL
ncbi:hypothetical protein ABD86_28250 [Paenibacillus alvei]|nr:hypothetical protein [Paenibacillus alvei]MBG9747659.1 hypothetical protein [Paenibacillus alvei]